MKILLATSAIIPSGGGIASYNQELINAIGQNNAIYALTDEKLEKASKIIKVYSTYGKNIYSYEYCQSLVNQLNSSNYDLIINSNSKVISIICPYLSIPIVSVSHFVNGKLAIVAGYNAQFIERIIALSFYGKQFIERKFNVLDESKIKVIHNSVDLTDDIFDVKKTKVTTIKIVYPGGTSIQKSFDVVIRVLRKLSKDKSLNFKFYWLGNKILPSADICLAKDISSLINPDKRILFLGKIKRDKAIEIMKESNIFLLPSRGEGCPMTLLEAMQFGCIPIVSDAHHGSREILEDGDFGLIVKNNSVNSLYKAILSVMTLHENYSENYLKTYNYSRTHLSKKAWISQMQNLIKESVIKSSKEVVLLSKKHFVHNVRKFKAAIWIERRKDQLRSLLSSIICNWLFLSK